MKYVEKRNELRKPILEDLQQQTLTIDNLNIANLNILHNESQCALLSLEKEMNDFDTTRDSIQELNNRVLRDFIIANSQAENKNDQAHQQAMLNGTKKNTIVINGKAEKIPYPNFLSGNSLLDIAKQIVIELSKFRDIQ